jgi:SAM-dependent methyltransferase
VSNLLELGSQNNRKAYSPQFENLIVDEKRAKSLVEGSFCIGHNYIGWRTSRQFIADLINKPGTIIDIGCANGFLLRSLQEWSDFELIPYGIDISELHIRQAKKLFFQTYDQAGHDLSGNFACASIEEAAWLGGHRLPAQYDFVYCTIAHTRTAYEEALKLVRPGGRLICGFYGRNEYAVGSPGQLEEKQLLLRRVARLKEQGCVFDGVVENPFGTGHIIAWRQC